MSAPIIEWSPQYEVGIRFMDGAGDCMAIHNTSYGSRQGIRVYGATNILASGNTLFRNENCGIYLAFCRAGRPVALGCQPDAHDVLQHRPLSPAEG